MILWQRRQYNSQNQPLRVESANRKGGVYDNEICEICKNKPQMEDNAANIIKLTGREKSILHEIAAGWTTPQIAAKLGLSSETVKWYRKQLLVKFSAATSAEVVRKAIQNGII